MADQSQCASSSSTKAASERWSALSDRCAGFNWSWHCYERCCSWKAEVHHALIHDARCINNKAVHSFRRFGGSKCFGSPQRCRCSRYSLRQVSVVWCFAWRPHRDGDGWPLTTRSFFCVRYTNEWKLGWKCLFFLPNKKYQKMLRPWVNCCNFKLSRQFTPA